MFLKHLGDLLFQITTGSEIFEPSAATKKAVVRRFKFLPFLHLDFSTMPFSGKALKNQPSSSLFQMFLNS